MRWRPVSERPRVHLAANCLQVGRHDQLQDGRHDLDSELGSRVIDQRLGYRLVPVAKNDIRLVAGLPEQCQAVERSPHVMRGRVPDATKPGLVEA